MHPIPRRTLLGGAATLAVLPAARPAAAQPGPRQPFDLPPTTIPVAGAIWLNVNGDLRQSAGLRDMTWSLSEQINHLSTAIELQPGNLIPSGTPENVGPVVPDGLMEGHTHGLPAIHVRTVAA